MVDSPGGREVGRLSLKVLPDTSEFVPKLEAFVERVEHQLKVRIPVELDLDSAWDDIKEFQARVKAADTNVIVDVEVDGAGALAHMDTVLAAMQGTADLNKIHVDVEIDAAAEQAKAAVTGAMAEAGQQGSAAMSRIGAQIALWGPLIFIAAVGIAALAPSLAVVLPLVAGIAAAGAVFALGWKQMGKVFQPLVKDIKAMRAAIGDTLTAGLSPLIAKVSDQFMPVLKEGLTLFAKLMNGMLRDTLHFLQSTPGLALMGQLFTGLATALKPFADLLPWVLRIFLRLTIAALPALQMMGDALLGITKRFNSFLARGGATGPITTSMQQLGEVLSIIGKLVSDIFPSLLAAAPAVIAFLSGFGSTFGSIFKLLKPVFALMSKHKTTMGAFGAALAVVVIGLGGFAAVMLVVNAVMATNVFVLAAVALVAVGAGMVYAYKHSAKFRKVIDTIWSVLKPFVNWVVDHWKLIATVMLAPIAPVILLVGVIVANFGKIRSFIVGVFNFLLPYLKVAWDIIKAVVQVAIAYVLFQVGLFKRIITIVVAVWSATIAAIRGAWTIIKTVVKIAIALVLNYIDGVKDIVGVFRNAFTSAKTAIGDVTGKIVTYVKGIPDKIKVALLGFTSMLYDIGKNAINGLKNGIVAGVKGVVGAIGDAASAGVNAAKKRLHISSPSKVFFSLGVYTMQGFQFGVESQAKAVLNSVRNIAGDTSAAMATVFDPAAANVSTGSLAASVGAIVDNTSDNHAKEVILNWQTGRGVMVDIAGDEMARKEFLASQDQLMGVGS